MVGGSKRLLEVRCTVLANFQKTIGEARLCSRRTRSSRSRSAIVTAAVPVNLASCSASRCASIFFMFRPICNLPFSHTEVTILPASERGLQGPDLQPPLQLGKTTRGLWRRPDGPKPSVQSPETKTGVFVSTISIVGGCRDLLDRVPADQIRAAAAVADATGGSWWRLVARC